MNKKLLAVVLCIFMLFSFAACNSGGTEYTVKFDLNGGSGNFPDVKVKEGKAVAEPTSKPTKSNFEFVDWSTQKSVYSAYRFSTAVNNNLTLYAIWKTPGAAMVTVTLDANGGTGSASFQIESGSKISPDYDPSMSGKIFIGWTTVKNDESTLIGSDTELYQSTILYAFWTDYSDNAAVLNAYNKTMSNVTGEIIEVILYNEIRTIQMLLADGTVTALDGTLITDFSEYDYDPFIAYLSETFLDGMYYTVRHQVGGPEHGKKYYEKCEYELTEERSQSILFEYDFAQIFYGEDARNVFPAAQIEKSGNIYIGSVAGVTFEVTLNDGYVEKIVCENQHMTATFTYYVTEKPLAITAPSLESGAEWRVAGYKVTAVLPDGLGQTHLYRYTGISPSDFQYAAGLPVTYICEGVYFDQAFTQEITEYTSLTGNTVVYIKAQQATGDKAELLTALDALDNSASLEYTKKHWSENEGYFGDVIIAKYLNGRVTDIYCEESDGTKIWYERRSFGSSLVYTQSGGVKTYAEGYLQKSYDLHISNIFHEIKYGPNDITKNGNIYKISNYYTVKVENGKITEIKYINYEYDAEVGNYDLVYTINYGTTALPSRDTSGWTLTD